MFFAALAIALTCMPGVLAGNHCINHQRHRCQWSNCITNNAPSPLNHHIEASTRGTSRQGICRRGAGNYPGDDCCEMYGTGCWMLYRDLWCEAKTTEPVAEYKGPRGLQHWIESKELWREACRDVGGRVWRSTAAVLFHVDAAELCFCDPGQRWFDGRCINTALKGL